MSFFSLNDIKMRHLENRLLGKCFVLYLFVNLKVFHPKWRNFDLSEMRILDTSISQMIFDAEISRLPTFSIWSMPGHNRSVAKSRASTEEKCQNWY
jgi:hypothetical protein